MSTVMPWRDTLWKYLNKFILDSLGGKVRLLEASDDFSLHEEVEAKPVVRALLHVEIRRFDRF